MGPWRWLGPRVAQGVPSERLTIEGWFRSFMITIYLAFGHSVYRVMEG